MADLQKTIEIIFSGTDSSFSKSVESVESALTGLNTKIGATTQPLADFASAVEKTGAALTAMAAGGLAYAYTKANEFQSASIDLQKVLGDQKDKIGEAEQAAIDMSNAYGESATNILQSAANFKQAGFDFDESMTLVKDSLDLMIAGDMSAAQASEILVSTLKGFREPASEASRLIDVLNEVSNEYATNVTELGTGMAKLSPVASTMGFSFEETAGLLTPVIEVFRSGSEAADALKVGLLKIVSERGPVTEALQALGVSQTDVNGVMRSGKDILHDIQVRFQSLTQEEKIYYASQLVGLEQSGRMMTVFDNLAKTTEITAVAMKASGSAQEEVNLRLASGEVQVKKLVEGWNNLTTAIGKQFQDAATSAVSGATEIEKALATAVKDGTFDEVFEAIRNFSENLSENLKEIAQNLPEALENVDWSGIMDSLGGLGDAIKDVFNAFFGDIDLTTAEGLSEALQTIVNGFQRLTEVTTGIVESFKPAAEYLGEWAKGATDASSETSNLVGKIAGFGQQINTISELLPTFGTALSVFAGASMINAIANVGSLATGLAGIAGPIGLAVTAAGALGAAIGATTGPIDVLGEGMAGFEDTIGLFSDALDTAKDTVSDFSEFAGTASSKMNDLTADDWEIQVHSDDTEVQSVLDILADLRRGADAPVEMAVEVNTEGIGEAMSKMNDLKGMDGKSVTADFYVDVDAAGQKWMHKLESYENGVPVYVVTKIDEPSAEAAKKQIEELPKQKELEMKLKGSIDKEIAAIKANADTVQTAMEWTAKLNIAQAEADADKLKSMLSNTADIIGSMGDAIASMFSVTPKDSASWMVWYDTLKQQRDIQQQTADLNKQILEQQIKLMKLREERLKAGDALIKIETSGLEPYLEEIMWAIVNKCHVRAAESADNFLLGI